MSTRPTFITLGPADTCHENALLHYLEQLHLTEYYGAVDTTWVVYGPRKRFDGAVIGTPAPWLFEPALT